MLRKTTRVSGEEAAQVFYDDNRFMRQSTTPVRVQKTLFGQGGVQGMDGDTHRCRKLLLVKDGRMLRRNMRREMIT